MKSPFKNLDVNFIQSLNGSLDTVWTPEDPDDLHLAFSVGISRKSARLHVKSSEVEELRYFLAGWEPEDLDSLSPAEVARRTIALDPEGNITFKTSFAKNSRTAVVPAANRQDFLDFLHALDTYSPEFISEAQAMNAKKTEGTQDEE